MSSLVYKVPQIIYACLQLYIYALFFSLLLLYERHKVPLEGQIYAKVKIKLTRYVVSLKVQSKQGVGVKENIFCPFFTHRQYYEVFGIPEGSF